MITFKELMLSGLFAAIGAIAHRFAIGGGNEQWALTIGETCGFVGLPIGLIIADRIKRWTAQ